jgi:hypothetical protein
MRVMPWAAGLTVAVAVIATLAALRAKRASPRGVAVSLVLMLLGLFAVSLYLDSLPHLPFQGADVFLKWLTVLTCVTGVGACILGFARGVLWVVLPFLFFGYWAVLIWALWNGPPRLF